MALDVTEARVLRRSLQLVWVADFPLMENRRDQ